MDKITFSLASIPERENCLKTSLQSILPQADQINIYLNNYDHIPDCLNHPKIEVARSQDHGDLKDNGKFFWLSKTKGYCFVLDDDVLISSNYVKRMVEKVEEYQRNKVIANHGSIFLQHPIDNYFSKNSRKVLTNIKNDTEVHVVGTGSIAFHHSTLNFSIQDCIIPEMTDIWFSIAAKKQNVSMVVVAERNKRLSLLDQNAPGLYEKYLNTVGAVQTRLINESGLFKL